MPVKSLSAALCTRKVARLLCPLLCPYVDGHAGGSRGGIGSERAALGYNVISRDVRCKGVVAGRCRTLNLFRSHPKKFLTRPFQFPRSDNHVTVCLCQRSAPRGPRRSSSHVDDQGAPHGDPRVPLQGGACQHRPFGRWIGPWRAPRPPLKSLVENIARCWGSPEALPVLERCEGPNVVAQLLTRPPLLCFRRA